MIDPARSGRWKFLIISLAIVILDQITKRMIVEWLPLGQEIRLFNNDLIRIQHVLNPGMAFGLRFFPRAILILASSLAGIGLAIYLLRTRYLPRWQALPLAIIIGGAIGNLIDRIFVGQVVDFVSVDFPDFIMSRFPTFNVADSAVSVGVTALILFSLFDRGPESDPGSDAPSETAPSIPSAPDPPNDAHESQ